MGQRKNVGLGVLIGFLSAFQVHAQPAEELATRRQLIEEAQNARKAEDHQTALSAFERAGRIQMTPSLRLLIAEEQSAVGELSNSLMNGELCAAEAAQDKTLRNRERIIQACNNLVQELKRIAAQVIVLMPTPVPPGAQVSVGGHVVPESLFGKPYALSPGRIDVDATAPGSLPFHRELFVSAGEEVRVPVELLPVPMRPPETKVPVARPEVAAIAPPPEKNAFRRIGPYAVLGLGAAGLGTSALFFVLQNNATGQLEAQCSGPDRALCLDTPNNRSLQRTASTDNKLAKISLVVGAAAVTGGAIWLILEMTGARHEVAQTQLQIAPTAGGALVGVGGKF